MAVSTKRIAVIGTGPAGLAALKALTEEGFDVEGFESRDRVGGIWAFTENPAITSATLNTRIQLSKFLVGIGESQVAIEDNMRDVQIPMTDFPFPDDFPRHPSSKDLASYYSDYASEFGLHAKITFNKQITTVDRDPVSGRWLLSFKGEDTQRAFDKVVLSTGSECVAKYPEIENIEAFRGTYIHSQACKHPRNFAGKNVVVLGQGNTAADLAVEISRYAARVHLAHRRSAMIIPRIVDGQRYDKISSWKVTRTSMWIESLFPSLFRFLFYHAFAGMVAKAWGKFDPQWQFDLGYYHPSNVTSMLVNDDLVPALHEARVLSTTGIRRVIGSGSLEMDDKSTIDDVDCIIACTGYDPGLGILGDALKYTTVHDALGPVPQLYQNIFPIDHADSLACLGFSIVLDNAATCREIAAMAVAQVWAGKSKLPTRAGMNNQIQHHEQWLAMRCDEVPLPQQPALVEMHPWLKFINQTAGTGIYEHMGWSIPGIWFFLRHPSLYLKMAWGVHTPHMYRFFETGKRKSWKGAEEAILHVNKLSKLDLQVAANRAV